MFREGRRRLGGQVLRRRLRCSGVDSRDISFIACSVRGSTGLILWETGLEYGGMNG